MANAYRQIFTAPGSIAFSSTGFLARMPMSMISIGLMTMFAVKGESYSDAGYIAASYVLSNAFLAPQISRLADLYGQARIAWPATIISVISLCILLTLAQYNAPLYLLIFAAIMTGFMPSFGSFVRTRWSKIYGGSGLLRAAFAFESIMDEIIFMVGPIIAIMLTNHFFPAAGPLSAGLIMLIGCFLFTSQKATEPKPYGRQAQKTSSVIRLRSIQLLAILLFFVGTIFGTAEITDVALAKSLNQAAYTPLPLVFYAFGSFIAGITYGALPIKMALSRQLLWSVLITLLTTIPMLLVRDLWDLSIVLFIAGATCSPTIIISMSLVESIVPIEKLTEGMSWAITGLATGVAAGAAFSGQLIDYFEPVSGFYIAVLGGFFALILTFFGQKHFTPKTVLKNISIAPDL